MSKIHLELFEPEDFIASFHDFLSAHEGWEGDEYRETFTDYFGDSEDDPLETLGDHSFFWNLVEETIPNTYVYRGEREQPLVINGLEFDCIEREGGEGEGSRYHITFSVSDGQNTRYFKKVGYYSSYEGTDWEGHPLFEVKPIDRIVRFYE